MKTMTRADWTLKDSIGDYEEDGADELAKKELNWFKRMADLKEVVRKAARSEDEDGVVFSHQRKNKNFWKDAIPEATKALVRRYRDYADLKNFHAIYELTASIIKNIPGVRELYTYDVSFRIGAFLGVYPKYVYLHTGTLDGAKKLGLETKNRVYLEMGELPSPLRGFKPWEVEDILCHHNMCYRRYEREPN